jgi:hypothetical protein
MKIYPFLTIEDEIRGLFASSSMKSSIIFKVRNLRMVCGTSQVINHFAVLELSATWLAKQPVKTPLRAVL